MHYHCIWVILISVSFSNGVTIIDSDPPKPWQRALMARYVIHVSDWIALSTISTLNSVKTYPFVNLKSMSDGPLSQSTGIPYIYMTSLDISGKDLIFDNRCTVCASLAESDYCRKEDIDPQDPRCARVFLSGRFVKVNNSSDEYAFAENALFSRHPKMKQWPKRHQFYIGKLEIELVMILDDFGGVKLINLEDYFNANMTLLNDLDL
ncbi:hypothetical protein RN001_004683 [Aquatica leii]|uniref:CREG-like beta-barrel domain-containing protein n=1 Tax=Aquatica leii TaxID=1421715 RepID=A0AAN7PBP3_9COLE|nr:hypothetical protein RN001_004683 [Aquatica leii]